MAGRDLLAIWKVRCLNRKTKQFFDRTLFLDPSTVRPDELRELVPVLRGGRWDRRVLKYRGRFKELPAMDLDSLVEHATHVVGVCLPDYFEDELGNPMAPHELVAALTGEAEVVLLGDPRSVLALGPSGVKGKDKWSAETANKIARFLQVGRAITESRWLMGPLRLSSAPQTPGRKPAVSLEHPGRDATASMCLWVRQLCSSDDALNVACNAYIGHVADARKALWVRERKDAFNKYLREGPQLLGLPGYPARALLERFMYGSGLVHTRSAKAREQELGRLVAEQGRPRVAAAFSFCCMEICGYALDIYPVLKQDFEHWVRSEGCAPPTWPGVRDLLP